MLLRLVSAYRLGHRVDDVAREDTPQAQFLARHLTSDPVNVHGGARGVEAVHLLREKRAEHPAEDVTGAGFG